MANARGMTLLEVMVAVAVLSVMGALTYGGLSITIRSQQRADVLQERYHASRVFLGRFKREVGMAFLSLHQAQDKRTQTLFEGERDRIVFNTSAYEPIRRNAHRSDQMEVEYRVDRDDEGVPSIIRRAKHHIDDRPGDGGREEVVLRGVEEFELQYYDKADEDWQDDWEVFIEDAVEKRQVLKTIQRAREQAEELRNEQGQNVGQMVGSEAAAQQVDEMADQAGAEAMEEIFLPNRVKVHLVISDEEGREYTLETQMEIRVTDPLWY
ncbi:MAG: type II secretion system protein GspJ [Myxococcota bacterium]